MRHCSAFIRYGAPNSSKDCASCRPLSSQDSGLAIFSLDFVLSVNLGDIDIFDKHVGTYEAGSGKK
jgi:hypothetical protein